MINVFTRNILVLISYCFRAELSYFSNSLCKDVDTTVRSGIQKANEWPNEWAQDEWTGAKQIW